MYRKFAFLLILVFVVGCVPSGSPPGKVTPLAIITPGKVEGAAMTSESAPIAGGIRSTLEIKTLEEALASGLPVVLELGSDDCPYCVQMKPIMEDLKEEMRNSAVFLTLDLYQHKDLAIKFQVRGIPAFIFYDSNGVPKGKVEGAMSKNELLRTAKGFGII